MKTVPFLYVLVTWTNWGTLETAVYCRNAQNKSYSFKATTQAATSEALSKHFLKIQSYRSAAMRGKYMKIICFECFCLAVTHEVSSDDRQTEQNANHSAAPQTFRRDHKVTGALRNWSGPQADKSRIGDSIEDQRIDSKQ